DHEDVAAAPRAADAVEAGVREAGDLRLCVVVAGVVAARRGARVDLGEAVRRRGRGHVVAEVALAAGEHVDERRAVVRRGGRGRGCRGRAGKHADGERRGERAGDGAAQQAGPATKGCGVVPTGSDSAVKTRGGCSGHVDSPWGVVPRLPRLEGTPYVARVTTSRRAHVPHPVEDRKSVVLCMTNLELKRRIHARRE